MKVIAWAYMVEAECGLTKTQIEKLMNAIPEDTELVPFDNDESGLIEANSIAYGFLNLEYYEELQTIKEKLAEVCNDFEKEKSKGFYKVNEDCYVKMYCDSETVAII